jgi:hypothetical protein
MTHAHDASAPVEADAPAPFRTLAEARKALLALREGRAYVPEVDHALRVLRDTQRTVAGRLRVAQDAADAMRAFDRAFARPTTDAPEGFGPDEFRPIPDPAPAPVEGPVVGPVVGPFHVLDVDAIGGVRAVLDEAPAPADDTPRHWTEWPALVALAKACRMPIDDAADAIRALVEAEAQDRPTGPFRFGPAEARILASGSLQIEAPGLGSAAIGYVVAALDEARKGADPAGADPAP